MSQGSSGGKISKGRFKQVYCQEQGIPTLERKEKQIPTISKLVLGKERVLEDSTHPHSKLTHGTQSYATHVNESKPMHQTIPTNGTTSEAHALLAGFLNVTKQMGNKPSPGSQGLQSSANMTGVMPSKNHSQANASTGLSKNVGSKSDNHKPLVSQTRHANVSRKVKALKEKPYDDIVESSHLHPEDGGFIDGDPGKDLGYDAEVSPATPQDEGQSNAHQHAAPSSEDVFQDGNTSFESDEEAVGIPWNEGDYRAMPPAPYRQEDDYTEATNPPDSAEGVKDLGLPDSNNDEAEEVSLKRYRNIADSLGRFDYGGVDDYQPQDDFTVTMDPEQQQEFSDERDDRDNILDSYQTTMHNRPSYWAYV